MRSTVNWVVGAVVLVGLVVVGIKKAARRSRWKPVGPFAEPLFV